MDKRIRRHELCIVGLPRCDFVFSSTRSCFIAYGFDQSTLEMTILRNLLERRGIQAVEAGGTLAPAQNAFCAKICSKMITAQFCIVLLNSERIDGREVPNANVNMEYGLMLGFNKYVIPFQRAALHLPFNVASLDTIKYTDQDFERLAAQAIDQAIAETTQESSAPMTPDQLVEAFLLTKRALVARIDSTGGDRELFDIGRPFGFNLLHDFSAMNYTFFGNFTQLRSETVLWRVQMVEEVLDDRIASLPIRVKAGILNPEQATLLQDVLDSIDLWLLVNSEDDKVTLLGSLAVGAHRRIEVFGPTDVEAALVGLQS